MACTTPPELLTRQHALVVGRSGELATLSELLLRGWLPARPEIDVGDDALILDGIGTLLRVQIKSATSTLADGGRCRRAQFSLRLDQIQTAQTPDLCYVLATRIDDQWTNFVILSRDDLRIEHDLHGVGSAHQGRLTLNLYFRSDGTVMAGTSHGDAQRDWTRFRDRWPQAA
ncbi:PDDEXK-like family protein [Paraliomyxa miuraensis]|uniref:hypothetical protein n=1 Tax=Paraliomyxa miuraensis TaxID=376150 RepID=UPI00224E84C6|nr:hypothetical protein [Paraliomyxa miuraensis]MCX4242734.1 hypothetical protein [Paraliomyxa miuraensis]